MADLPKHLAGPHVRVLEAERRSNIQVTAEAVEARFHGNENRLKGGKR